MGADKAITSMHARSHSADDTSVGVSGGRCISFCLEAGEKRSRPFVLQHHMKDPLICHRQVPVCVYVCVKGGSCEKHRGGIWEDT